MARIPLEIAIGDYESSSKRLAAQEVVNMFPKVTETAGGLSHTALFSSPGVTQVASAGTGPYRGHEILDGELYVVSGGGFYKVASDWTVTSLGNVSGSDRCILSSNGQTIAIQVPGGSGYWYDTTNGLQEITDATYQSFQAQDGGVLAVTTKDGYFVFVTQFEAFLSDLVTLNGGRGFPELSFFTAEIKPDKNVTTANVRNELYVVGEDTIELFQNTGAGESQPFQRIESATIDKGLSARHAFIEHLDEFVFIGGGRQELASVYRGTPGGAVKISTTAIDDVIGGFTKSELASAYAFSFQESGNFFVGFTIKDKTIIYDTTSSALLQRPVWHTRESSGSSLGQWRVAAVVDAYAVNVVFDTEDGRVGVLSRSTGTEYGSTIERRFTGQYLSNAGAPIFINEVEVALDTPTITTTGQMIELETSFDGANSFVSMGSVSIGSPGSYSERQIWRRIGRAPYQVLFRLTMNNTDATNIVQMFAEVEGGSKWL